MHLGSRSISLGLFCLAGTMACAQIQKPAVPLQLDGDPQTVQVPSRAMLFSPQCDSSGAVYVRYSPMGDDTHPGSVRIDTDGSTRNIPPVDLSNSSGDTHVFLLAAGGDDLLHEIVRVPAKDHVDGDTEVRYVNFDQDGSLHTQAAFTGEFIPSMLLPLPSGDFFAAGVILDSTADGVHEGPIAGIFNSDAQLKRRLENTSKGLVSLSSGTAAASNEMPLDGAILRLGGDGNIYVLLPGENTRVEVLSQAGRVLRHMDLEQPFANGTPDDMFASGNRLLVVYEGEADLGATGVIYVLYDAQSGEVIRQYRPEFSGTAACFEDGQTVSVLVRQPSSGAIAIGTAELE
jgi:hypothetical protein